MLNNFINSGNLFISKLKDREYVPAYMFSFGGGVSPNGGTREGYIEVYKSEAEKGLKFSKIVLINEDNFIVKRETDYFYDTSTGSWNFTIAQK